MTLALCSVRVSTEEQRDSGAGAEAQRIATTEEAKRRGWDYEVVEDLAVSGGTDPMDRPGLGNAIKRLDAGEAQVLLIARLDRLGRSLAATATLLDRAQRKGWSVVTCDTAGLDMSTPTGRLVAGVLASAASFERDLIRQRTREALAARKAAGVILGRPRRLPDSTVERIVTLRAEGLSMAKIARVLDSEQISTAGGSPHWGVSSVEAVLKRRATAGT